MPAEQKPWKLYDYNGGRNQQVSLADRVLLPTGSHNPDSKTGGDCITLVDKKTVERIAQVTSLQVVIVAPPDVAMQSYDQDETLDVCDITEKIRSLGRIPIVFCNTARSSTATLALRRAELADEYNGIKNIKLEVVRSLKLKNKQHTIIPEDAEIARVNKKLADKGFNVIPIMSCFPDSGTFTQETARRLIGDGANGIRLYAGYAGGNTGIIDQHLFASTVGVIRDLKDDDFPIIAEGGMTPESVVTARKAGATAALVNHWVASSTNQVVAAKECVAAASASEHSK